MESTCNSWHSTQLHCAWELGAAVQCVCGMHETLTSCPAVQQSSRQRWCNVQAITHLPCAAALPMPTGDIADTAAAVSAAFQLLVERFWRVVWVPGNHCLWLRGDTRDSSTYPDSWAKLMALRQVKEDCCNRNGSAVKSVIITLWCVCKDAEGLQCAGGWVWEGSLTMQNVGGHRAGVGPWGVSPAGQCLDVFVWARVEGVFAGNCQ
jgi:hypothetical protein